jgi:hypothetical protein
VPGRDLRWGFKLDALGLRLLGFLALDGVGKGFLE